MSWVTYEEDRIVHVPSNNVIIMKSRKIAWNNDSLKDCIIISDGDSVYDSENEDDFRKLRGELGFGIVMKDVSPRFHIDRQLGKRYVVKRRKTDGHSFHGYSYDIEQYNNVTDYYVIKLISGYYSGQYAESYRSETRLLFVSKDAQAFEKAKQALQFGLRAVRLDELNGMPSDCAPGIFQLLK